MGHERTLIVLAAGQGKRMKSAMPKVLHPVLGRTLLGHVLAGADSLQPTRRVVVIGHGADQVAQHLALIAPDAVTAVQVQQRGTGHAARIALDAIGPIVGTVVVINGDIPLLRPETLAGLVEAHESADAAATILTAIVTHPYGLGRIIRRTGTNAVDAIVEERDANDQQRGIREINAGLYAFDAGLLSQVLGKLGTHNDQGEEYLTDAIGLLVDSGRHVTAYSIDDAGEVLGCNDRVELAALHAVMRDRVNEAWMRAGVTIIDPATTWIDATVVIGRDSVIEPNTHVRGYTTIGERVVVGPDTTLIDTRVAAGATIVRTHAVGADIGPDATVGPYAYLRPGTVLHDGTKVGAFVEVKNSTVGAGTKIPHLSYVGDADIGENTNIGAANVVVNYDGVAKHRTTIGAHVRTGSDTMLVAPVTIGDGAYTAAGSVITQDVPPGALGVGRATQRNVEGWVDRQRPGSASADAAAAARANLTSNGHSATHDTPPEAADPARPTKGDTASE